jgi:hypothetical protein
MKKGFILILPALLIFLSAQAQTKKIGVLSHSGKFASANHAKSDGGFGLDPEMFRYSERQWDSIHRADSIRNDSAQRASRPNGTGAKYVEPAKTPQPPPESSYKAGSWPKKSQH